jgi:hypothetical protein
MRYNWIDRYLLAAFKRGEVKAKRWVSLGEAWRDSRNVGNIATVRRDGKVLYKRGI